MYVPVRKLNGRKGPLSLNAEISGSRILGEGRQNYLQNSLVSAGTSVKHKVYPGKDYGAVHRLQIDRFLALHL